MPLKKRRFVGSHRSSGRLHYFEADFEGPYRWNVNWLMYDNSREFLVHNSLIIWFLAFSLERRSVRSAYLKLGVKSNMSNSRLVNVRSCYDERS